jgi:hypothetical protein
MIGDQVLLNSQEIAKILSGKTDINTVEFSTPNESEVKKMSSYLKGYNVNSTWNMDEGKYVLHISNSRGIQNA